MLSEDVIVLCVDSVDAGCLDSSLRDNNIDLGARPDSQSLLGKSQALGGATKPDVARIERLVCRAEIVHRLCSIAADLLDILFELDALRLHVNFLFVH